MLILLKGSVSHFDTYLEVFGIFLPKTEEKKTGEKNVLNAKVCKRVGGWSSNLNNI